MSFANQEKKILIVEDNPIDIVLLSDALSESSYNFNVKIFNDGDQAINFIKQSEELKIFTPEIIILDLRMPKKDGHEVLKEIRANELLKKTSVIIFSSSHSQEDVVKSFNEEANCYYCKTFLLDEFVKDIEKLLSGNGNDEFAIINFPSNE